MVIEKLKHELVQKIKAGEALFLEQLLRDYSVYFFTETKKDVYDDGNPFDTSGVLLDTGELYDEADYTHFLDFLENAYNGQTSPTFISGCGLNHDTYDRDVEEDALNWLHEQVIDTGKQLIANGLLFIEDDEGIFEFIEKYDAEQEIDCFILEYERYFVEKLSEVTMGAITKIGYSELSPQQKKHYDRLREANQFIRKLKSLANEKNITVSSHGRASIFSITDKGDVQGSMRTFNNTYQKELITLLIEDNVSVIVRQLTNIQKAGDCVEIVYGFLKVDGVFKSLPSEMVARSFDQRLPNEMFKQLNL